MTHTWRSFGLDHLAALAVVALLAWSATRFGRAGRVGRGVRLTLASMLLGLLAGELALAWRGGWLTWTTVLPLQLCDLAVLLAAYGLVTLDRRVIDLLYFWAGSGTLLATLTPDLAHGFPALDYFVFFGLHGLVIVAAALLVLGLDLRPSPRAWWRAFVVTLAYACLVGLFNAAWGTNFLYLCRKPVMPTMLDAFGPWPYYLLVCAALALVSFRLLDLALRRRNRAAF